MAIEKHMNALADFLPPGTFELVVKYLHHYKVHLTVTRERSSVLGDYRNAVHGKNHRISVNGNLNHYAFLITLVHELAHLVTFMEYGNRVQAHGREWKHVYRLLLVPFLDMPVFPADVLTALRSSLHNLPASSCADEPLMRVLRRYDKKEEGMLLVEELPEGALFVLDDGKIFKKGQRLRKRFQCIEVKSGKLYLFSPIYEVKKLAVK